MWETQGHRDKPAALSTMSPASACLSRAATWKASAVRVSSSPHKKSEVFCQKKFHGHTAPWEEFILVRVS